MDVIHEIQDQLFMNCQNMRIHVSANWRDHSIGMRLLDPDYSNNQKQYIQACNGDLFHSPKAGLSMSTLLLLDS